MSMYTKYMNINNSLLEHITLLDNNESLFTVYKYENKIRVGENGNDGWVIGDACGGYDSYISTCQDNKFSIELINKYNISINNCYSIDYKMEKMTYVNKKIGFQNNIETTNLSDIICNYKNSFVKIDIKSKEWEWLESIDIDILKNIKQLLIKIHGLTNESYHNIKLHNNKYGYEEKTHFMKKLSESHYIIHAHGNNNDKVAYNGLPNVLEITYLNKKLFDKQPDKNVLVLPIKNLDYPSDNLHKDIDLNFAPFSNNLIENVFKIDVEEKENYTTEELELIQIKLNKKKVDNVIESLYKSQNYFYDLCDFNMRISRGISQTIIDTQNNLVPNKYLYKIGNGGDNKNCFVCCTAFANKKNSDDSRFIASHHILKSLEDVGFNGYFYLLNGGFPNPTGKEMKYIGVPYCFKIFMMLEAEKCGFERIIWLDSRCYAINNPQPLFDLLKTNDTMIKTIDSNNNYNAMSFNQVIKQMNHLTKTDISSAKYIETIVFGLNIKSYTVKSLIKEYYKMVELGWPFFSIFPEEIVFSYLFNKTEFKNMLSNNINQQKVRIHENYMTEHDAKINGYYFYHKEYKSNIKYNESTISFIDNRGRFGNQLFCYVTCKLFTIITGHSYVPIDNFSHDNYIEINDENIDYYITNFSELFGKNVLCKGYFQKSIHLCKYRDKLIEIIYNKNNNDYWTKNGVKYFIKDYLIDSKHNVLLKCTDIVISLRLDDFIQYPCKTSDIIPPQHYIYILNKLNIKNQTVYIVCDKIKYLWEYKYIEYFKKWNPILIQESLMHDIALIRDCSILIHSNSSLCWIISFLSNKNKREIPYTPKLYMNHNQHLEKIEENDELHYVMPLLHDEVHNLDINDTTIVPFSFSVPDECVVKYIPKKNKLLASLIPGDLSTYIFDKHKEREYNEMYRCSRFAFTKKKGGWDCLRHYEILMNGCIPLFENLNECPKYTMTTYPKHLNNEAYELYNNWCDNEDFIEKYNTLCLKYLDHTRKYCTTSAASKYFINNIKNGDKIKNVLLITCHHGVNYNREMLWIGLKRYIESIDGVAVEYEKMPFLYDDYDSLSDNKYYGTNCFTFPKRLKKDKYYNMTELEIVDKIKSNFWDIIIYGKIGPDEFCEFPLFDIVRSYYNKNKIAFIFGGDEMFNLKIEDENKYYVNMFNKFIYYKPYADYLNYFKQFGTCFVRELDK